MRTILNWIFGCDHNNITWPQTVKRITHVACLDCSKELEYDWQEMRVVGEVKKAPMKQRKLAPVVDIGEVRRREA